MKNKKAIEFKGTVATFSTLTVTLRSNQLDTLPASIARLPLGKLDLRWNPLRARPAWLRELADTLVYT